MDVSARAEEGDEVNGRTSLVREGDLESDALQELLWDGEEWRGHGRRRKGREGQERGMSGEHRSI
jgi:hypothetical protein